MHDDSRAAPGAWPVAGDGVEFRVWAPDAVAMALCLHGTQRPMQRDPDGCHWLRTPASHGDRYRFRLPSGQEVPDPASRWQPDGLDGDSAVVLDTGQRGLPGTGMPGRTW